MKKVSTSLLNIILFLGMLFLVVGFLFFVGFSGGSLNIAKSVAFILFLVAGFAFLYSFLVFSNKPFFLFVGLMFALWGIFGTLMGTGIVPFSLKEWWPLFLLFSGIALFCSGKVKNKKIVIAYDFPALFLIVMSAIFLFFSFGLIDVSFSMVAVVLGPLLLICAGVFLVIIFLYRKQINSIIDNDFVDEDFDENAENIVGEDL